MNKILNPAGKPGFDGSFDGEGSDYYDDNEFDGEGDNTANTADPTFIPDSQGPIYSPYSIDVMVLQGSNIGPAAFTLVADSDHGPEPFVVVSIGGQNYASNRAVGTHPNWNKEIVTCNWDGLAAAHIQVLDQNELDTETLGEKFIDLKALQLEPEVAMPVEVDMGKSILYVEMIMHAQ